MKKLLKIFAWVAGTFVGLLVVAQIILSPAVATKLVNKYAPKFLDADLSFERVGISVFRSFPNLSLSLDEAVLTYPSDRFSREENAHRGVRLMAMGRGVEKDTLASFDNFRGSVSVPALIAGTVRIPSVELTHPRVFAKMYDDSTANWNIFKAGDKEKDTTSSGLPTIKVGHLRLADDPVIAFSDCKDTLYAMLHLEEMSFKGRFNTEKPHKSSGKFSVDSLMVNGRFAGDTLHFRLDELSLQGHRDDLKLHLQAAARAATRSFGRIRIPMSVDARVAFPQDSVLTAKISSLEANVAGLPLTASGTVSKYPDKLYLDAEAAIKSFRLGKALEEYGENFWSGAKDISTDAKLDLSAKAEGFFVAGNDSVPACLPKLSASVSIPSSSVRYAKVKDEVKLALDASAATDDKSAVNANVSKLTLKSEALNLDATATAGDLLGEDPLFGLDASLNTVLAKVMEYIPDLGITASGDLAADLSGSIRLSQLNSGFTGADLSGHLDSDRIDVGIPGSGLNAFAQALSVRLSSEGNTEDEPMRKGERMLALKMDVDSAYANIKDSTIFSVGDISLNAHSASTILGGDLKTKVHPMGGELSLARVFFRDASGTSMSVRGSKENFTVKPKDASRKAPLLSLTSENSRAFFRSGANRISASGLSLNASAELNNSRRDLSAKRKAFLDSLSRVYPDVPRDSLMRKALSSRSRSGRSVPDWMTEADFREKDLNVNLGETLTKYFKEWNISGGIDLERASIATPALPLRNQVDGLSGTFSNDRVDLKKLTFKSGDSDITAKGSVWGLSRFLLGKGILNLDLKMSSDVINADQLLAAYDAGTRMNTKKLEESDLDDSAYESKIIRQGETLVASADTSGVLIVVPGNLNAKILLEATEIDYASLVVDWMEADIVIKERTVQITNTCATSNVGDIYFEGFYSTRSKSNLKTGFYLNLVDITAEKVIDLIPAIDSIMPLLKSFSGMLDCTIAATTSLDEHMNLVIPSMNGVVRIKGTDLEINESQDFYKIAKTLMFRNKRQGHVDKMSVEGYLADSKLEVFPFLLKMDRYKLAISGIQNIDTSFKYHASVLKSPLLFRFGLNLNGNFDDYKLKLARAKYKKESKLPVFSKVIDQTTINLSKSINNIFQKGVEAAVAENEKQQAINDFKENTGYVAVVDMPEDTLSAKELKNLEKAEALSELDDLDLESLDSAKFSTLDSASVAKLDLVGLVRRDKAGTASLDTLALKKLIKEENDDDE